MAKRTTPADAPLLLPGASNEPTAAQRASIERTDLSMAVTSGAGCGKTYVLTQRYLRLLDQDGRPDAPSRIVAVTFTDKAALEMRQRVAAELSRRDDPLAAQWRRGLTDARISTIHGFASSLLRAWPVEAGVDPAFTVLADEFRRTRMREAACQEALRAGLTRRPQEMAELLTATGYVQVLDMLATLVDERWRWMVARQYEDSDKTLEMWRERREVLAEAAWKAPEVRAARGEVEELARLRCQNPSDKLAVHLCEQVKIMAELLDDPDSRMPESFARIETAGNMGSAQAWGSKEQLVEIRARLRRLVELFRGLALLYEPFNDRDVLSARLLAVLTQVARDAVRRYRAAKRRGGLLDFVDLQLGARALLRQEIVRRQVAQGISQLLIDEFQDTDSLQHELLYAAVNADGRKTPPGRVFFVGDAKQSIYRFRGAEVEVFERARQAIDVAGRQNLDLNFRTHRHGLALVNRIFARPMGESYEPLVAHRPDVPTLPAAEVILAECPDDADADIRYRAGARATAERIARMLADGEKRVRDDAQREWRPVKAGDIAILLPRLKHTGPFEEALDEHGVPYYVVAGAGLFSQQEVHDLVSALRAIDNPLDDIALMGFLRGGLVGLDDNVLAHLAMSVQPPYRINLRDSGAGGLPAALAQRLAAPAAARLSWAIVLLETLSAAKDACGPDALIRRLLEQTGYEAVLLAQHQGRRKVGNIRRVLAHAASAAAAGAALREFIDFVAALTMQEVRAEQAATETESGDVVRLMTIHKAKGLEFPVVFLADLNYQPLSRFENFNVRGPLGLTLRGGGDDEDAGDPQSWVTARMLEREAEKAEDLRTFYVAVTRHRDFIAFVGALEQNEDGTLGKSGSMLRLLNDSLGLGAARVDLGDGAVLLVNSVKTSRPRRRGRQSALDKLCLKSDGPTQLGGRLLELGRSLGDGQALPLLGAPATGGPPRISPRGLSLLAQCHALYRWHYELRVPRQMPAMRDEASALSALDGPTEESVLARCLQLVDLSRPQGAGPLIRQALGEHGLMLDSRPTGRELQAMLSALEKHPLWQTLRDARRLWRPVEFATRTSHLEIAGAIDVLFQDAAGLWQFVIFCADDIVPADVAACAKSRALQVDLCVRAAAKLLTQAGELAGDAPPHADLIATLYFLRPGVAHRLEPGAVCGTECETLLRILAERLASCRRTGQWSRCRGEHCGFCQHRQFCLEGSLDKEMTTEAAENTAIKTKTSQ